jgi:hypothetical protein
MNTLTEQDRKNLMVFIMTITTILILLVFGIIYCHITQPFTDCGYYQPEISWYSGSIGINDCGCK